MCIVCVKWTLFYFVIYFYTKLHRLCLNKETSHADSRTFLYMILNLNFFLHIYSIEGSFHLKSPKKSANLNGSDPDFDESAYIWSL